MCTARVLGSCDMAFPAGGMAGRHRGQRHRGQGGQAGLRRAAAQREAAGDPASNGRVYGAAAAAAFRRWRRRELMGRGPVRKRRMRRSSPRARIGRTKAGSKGSTARWSCRRRGFSGRPKISQFRPGKGSATVPSARLGFRSVYGGEGGVFYGLRAARRGTRRAQPSADGRSLPSWPRRLRACLPPCLRPYASCERRPTAMHKAAAGSARAGTRRRGRG